MRPFYQRAFLGLNNLRYLDLSGNKLTKILAGIFIDLKKLKSLNLDNNNIVHIDDEAFKYNRQLKSISLKNHKKLTSIKWISFVQKETKIHHFECPERDMDKCEVDCRKMSKVAKIVTVMIKSENFRQECQYCDCHCKSFNCSQECVGNSYKIAESQFGCKYCSCFCPPLDCDAPCGGKGLGIFGEKDHAGCFSRCNGCRNRTSKFQNSVMRC